MRSFELEEEQYEILLLALGTATAHYFQINEPRLAYAAVKLCNAINKDNPDFKPYEIPEEFQHG